MKGSFPELYDTHSPKMFGGENNEELLQDVRQYYSQADEKKWGVIGIRFKQEPALKELLQ